MTTGLTLTGGALLLIVSAAVTGGLIALIMPLLRRYALARPNARSSHAAPTPQGAGIVIILAVIAIIAIVGQQSAVGPPGGWPWRLVMALAMLAAIGAVDDIYPLPVLVRLVVQFAAAALTVFAVPLEARIFAFLPHWVELAGLIVGLVWLINLTNFMDGIDGITFVEMFSISVGAVLVLVVTGAPGSEPVIIIALGFIGALAGFAPFNRHVATVFLGDVGSLPIGALSGWMLLTLASHGFIAAALLLSLYYLSDATMTLYRRWRRGDQLHEAHRGHFYQLAVQRGFRVPEVTNRIFGLNMVLVLLALLTAEIRSPAVDIACLAAGMILTAALLRHFERGRNG